MTPPYLTGAVRRLKPILTLWVVIIFLRDPCLGQIRMEAGLAVGPSNFLGDLGGRYGRGMTFLKDNNIQLTRIMSGAYAAFSWTPHLVFRVAVNAGRLEGADSIIAAGGGHELTRMERNLHFRSPLAEAFLAAEFYPTLWMERNPDETSQKVRPYLLLGVGLFRFNPQAQYTDANGIATWVDLKPLRTEGQGMKAHPDRKEYDLTQVNIPYGFGIRYFVNERFYVGFEVVNRMTFTDYIDDVSTNYIPDKDFYDHFGANSVEADIAVKVANHSNLSIRSNTRTSFLGFEQRGNPRNNDAYYSMNLRLGMRLGDIGDAVFRRALDQTRCPHFFRW
jgi:hypothetical protein